MQAGDLFLLTLPTDSIKCKGMGVANPVTYQPYPIPGEFVLDITEQANIKARTDQFNQIIKATAATQKLAVADMNTYLKSFVSGMVFDGIKLSTTFVTGGLFSTDGVHLNPRGKAIAANYFIQAVNDYYGCRIPQADITRYPGLVFP
jgi:lysophospholipase L1-like esterase